MYTNAIATISPSIFSPRLLKGNGFDERNVSILRQSRRLYDLSPSKRLRSLLMPTSLLGLARTNDFAQHSHLSAANRAIFIASMHLCHSPTFKNRKPWHTPGNVKLLLPAHAFAMASPKTSGQQLWLRKSADTSSHPPISLIRRASPLLCSSAPPQIPNSSSGNGNGTGSGGVVCAIA